MSHVPTSRLHAYQRRAVDVQVDVDTDLDPEDFTDVEFRFGDFTKNGLEAVEGGDGVLINFTLTGADLDVERAWYRWECSAVVEEEIRTLAQGVLSVSDEPIQEEES